MNIDQYIQNPLSAGKASAVMSSIMREGMKKSYSDRFNNILMRENGEIKFYTYKDEKNNVYYIHLKIPSEVVAKFYYDVVFRFSTDASAINAGRSLNKYDVQFFSNDPAFVYTYAFVFNQKGLVIKDIASKLGKYAITKTPDIKNPDKSTGYVKSFYFAYLFMKSHGLFNSTAFAGAQAYSKNTLLSNIEDAESKIEKREEEGKKVSKKKKILVDADTAKILSHNKYIQQNGGMDNIVVYTNKVKKVKNVKAVNTIKGTKKSKKI